MSEKKSKHSILGWVIVIALAVYFFGGFGDRGPDGVYYAGLTKANSSFISFSSSNNNGGYISWTGNKSNGIVNCNTKGSYSYDKESGTILVSGFYNSNCSSISDRNGTWKYNGSTITSPRGVVFRK